MSQKYSLKPNAEKAKAMTAHLAVETPEKKEQVLGEGKDAAISLPNEMEKVFEAMKRTFERNRESGN